MEVDRRTVKNKVFKGHTTDGKKIVKIAKEIGVWKIAGKPDHSFSTQKVNRRQRLDQPVSI